MCDSYLNLQDAFQVAKPNNKTTMDCEPKADNILLGFDEVMTNDIRAAPYILSDDGETNLSEDAKSLRRCM